MKPCPFCGSDDVASLKVAAGHWVFCDACRSRGPIKLDKNAALESWNKRSAK